MPREKQSYCEYLFVGSSHDEPEKKVLEYIVHRVKAGAHLKDVVEEDYVLRNASKQEVNELIKDPELVHAARERMELTFGSEELRP